MSASTERRRPRFGLHFITWLTLAMMVYAIAFCQLVPWQRLELTGCIMNHYYDFGWPISFVRECPTEQRSDQFSGEAFHPYDALDQQDDFWLSPWRHLWPWKYAGMQVDHLAIVLDITIWLAILAPSITMLELRLRMSERLQFSLRGLLLVTAAIATMLSVLPAVGFQSWLDPNRIREQYFVELLLDNGWCDWAPECTLVAVILCIGLTCAFYAAGMLLFRVVHGATRVVIQRVAKRDLMVSPDTQRPAQGTGII